MNRFILAIFCLAVVVSSEVIPNNFSNVKIERRIDLNAHVVSIKVKYTINSLDGNLSKYYVLIPKDQIEHIAEIQAYEKNTYHVITRAEEFDTSAYGAYLVRFTDAVTENKEYSFSVMYYLINYISFLPEAVPQIESQLAVYNDNLYIGSPYVSSSQTTVVVLPTTKYESDTTKKSRTVKGKELNFGPFTTISPYVNYEALYIHYANNNPFITFTKVVREIEISHWGNIAYEESIYAKNTGAALEGEYSRLDYDNSYYRQELTKDHSWTELTAFLPKNSKDFYYRDIIGNISTSQVIYEKSKTKLVFETRFPMMGQWKTEFYWDRITYINDEYKLTTPFSTPIQDANIDELYVRVILPEYVSNVNYKLPKGVTLKDTSIRNTYLDTKGRTVYEFVKYNVLPGNPDEFSISYKLPSYILFREPLMCISAFFFIFILASVCNRLNLSLGNKKAQAEKVKTD
ncbi:hypothetical protein WA158_005326 [Blastocystis sp. Blastoise]